MPVAILSELDTTPRLLRLTAVVEDAARFLGQAGRLTGLDPKHLLDSFVVGAMGMDPQAWAVAAPQAVRQHVCLSHLAALYRCLEAAATGKGENAFLERVPAAYRSALSEAQANALLVAASSWQDRERVIAGLKGLIQNGTDATSGYGPGQSLREMLTCVEFLDEDGDDAWFLESFPTTLEMRHIVDTYTAITGFA